MMAKLFMEGKDVRELHKVCYLCHREITATQAFTMELQKETKYRHLDCRKPSAE
jgi:hypothetical protein